MPFFFYCGNWIYLENGESENEDKQLHYNGVVTNQYLNPYKLAHSINYYNVALLSNCNGLINKLKSLNNNNNNN